MEDREELEVSRTVSVERVTRFYSEELMATYCCDSQELNFLLNSDTQGASVVNWKKYVLETYM